MKRLLLSLCILLSLAVPGWAGLVNNSGSSAEDSIAIPFYLLDSVGNQVSLASGDSLYLVVFYPSGAVAFKDSMAYNNARITGNTWEDWNGGQMYSFKEAIANVDGTGVNGTYSYVLTVDDNTSAALLTSHRGEFQVLKSANPSSLFDYAATGYRVDPNARVYYVTKEGNDANDGLTWSTAWLTVDKAFLEVNRDSGATNPPRPQYVFFGSGEFSASTADTIRTRFVHLIGSGYGRTIVRRTGAGSSTDPVWRIGGTNSTYDADHLEIGFIDFWGPDLSTNILNVNLSDSIHIHDCNFYRGNEAINLNALTYGHKIHDNVIRFMDHDGILVSSDFTDVFRNAVMLDSSETAQADGIAASGMRGVYWQNAVVCSMTAFGQPTTEAGRNVFAGNWASSRELSGEYAYEWKNGKGNKYVGNWQQTSLQAVRGTDSVSSVNEELLGLYTAEDTIDWAAVQNPTATIGLTNTTVGTVTAVTNSIGTSLDLATEVSGILGDASVATIGVNVESVTDGAITDADVADGLKVDVNTWKAATILSPTADGSIIADIDSTSTSGGVGSVNAVELAAHKHGLDLDNTTGTINTTEFAAETDIVSSGAITTAGGAVSTVTTVTNSIGTSLSAAEVDADVSAEIWASTGGDSVLNAIDNANANPVARMTAAQLDSLLNALDLTNANPLTRTSQRGRYAAITSSPTTTSFRASALTEADNYWVGSLVTFWTSGTTRQTRRVTAFASATDEITFAPAVSTAYAVNDTAILWGLIDTTAGGSGGTWTATQIDSILNAIDNSNADPVARKSNVTCAAGSGALTDTIWAIDTSGTDTAIPNVVICATNASGTQIGGCGFTNGTGYVAGFGLPQSTSVTLNGWLPGYIWESRTITTTSATHDMDTIFGYNVVIPASGNVNLKAVYDYINPHGATSPSDSLRGYNVTATLVKPQPTDSIIRDTASGYVVGEGAQVRTETDRFGKFTLYLWPNNRLTPYTQWDISVKSKDGLRVYHKRVYLTGTATASLRDYY